LSLLGVVGLAIVAIGAWWAYRTLTDLRGKADEARRRAESAMRMRWLMVAVHEHHEKAGQFPASLEELRPWFQAGAGRGQLQAAHQMLKQAGVNSFEDVLENPLTGEQQGYEYVAPAARTSLPDDRDDTPVIFQLRAGRRADDLPAARLDGGVR
jgi:hypothetical protein